MKPSAKPLYPLLCLFLIAFTVWQFAYAIPNPDKSWDYQVYASATQSFETGQNPYAEISIPNEPPLYFDYPPHTLYYLWLLDRIAIYHSTTLYYLMLLGLLLASVYLIVRLDNAPDRLFLYTLTASGFMAAYWNFVNGNSPIIFLFLFAVMFTLIKKGNLWQSAIVAGFSATISMFTAPFIALYFLVRRPIKYRLGYMALSAGIVGALFLTDHLVNPGLFSSYLTMLRGSTSPIYYPGGWNKPAFVLLLRDITPDTTQWIVLCSLFAVLVLIALWEYNKNNAGSDQLKTLSITVIAIFLFLPYIPPYDYIILVLPIYLLFKDRNAKVKAMVLASITLPEFFVWVTPAFGFVGSNIPALGYAPVYGLLLVFVVAATSRAP